MSESASVADSPSRGSRAKRIIVGVGLLLLLLISLGLGGWCYLWTKAANKLASAIAKLDREDPGWRWDDLQARRAIVPDEENAALQLEAAFRLLPRRWSPKPVPQDDDSEEKTLVEQILDLEPVIQLSEALIKQVRVELEKVKPALVEARNLAGSAIGRFPAVPPEDVLLGNRSDYEQQPRPVANLLLADAALLAQDQKLDAALVSSRALLKAGQALGDDPNPIAHLVRIACRDLAVATIERILAQGQPSEDVMRASQKLLEDEEQQPLLLYASLGQRAFGHQQMRWLETADPQRLSVGAALGFWDRIQLRLGAGWTRESHAPGNWKS